jgi:hypothetical protein
VNSNWYGTSKTPESNASLKIVIKGSGGYGEYTLSRSFN